MIEEEDSTTEKPVDRREQNCQEAGLTRGFTSHPRTVAKYPRRHENSQHPPAPGKRAERQLPVEAAEAKRSPANSSSSPDFSCSGKKYGTACLRRHWAFLTGVDQSSRGAHPHFFLRSYTRAGEGGTFCARGPCWWTHARALAN